MIQVKPLELASLTLQDTGQSSSQKGTVVSIPEAALPVDGGK